MAQSQPRTRLDLAFDALAAGDWNAAAQLAAAALQEAEDHRDNAEAALARFLYGTTLAGPEDAGPEQRDEARRQLEAALPALRAMEELELTGEALLLLGGLGMDEARARGGLDPLERCERHYREAAELLSGLDAPESLASAFHNLGLCLTARVDREGDSREARRARLQDAISCFHDALEVELQNALPALAEATERERQLAQELLDRS